MRTVMLCCLVAGLAPSAGAAGQDAAQRPTKASVQEDVQALQGTWDLIAFEQGGKRQVPAAVAGEFEKWARNVTLDIKGEKLLVGEGDGRNRFTLRRAGKPRDWTIWLDPASKPKRFDLTFGSQGGLFGGSMTFEGIYGLKGDRLEVCCALIPREVRPTTFTTRANQEWRWLLVYRRAKSQGK